MAMEKNMNSCEIYEAKQRIKKDKLYQWAMTEAIMLQSDRLIRSSTSHHHLRFVFGHDPSFLIESDDFERYRNCTLEEAATFEDNVMLDGRLVSRSCLLSFLADNKELLQKPSPTIYVSLGCYARGEKDVVPGYREVVFPQLEIEIIAPSQYPTDEMMVCLFYMQERIARRLGLRHRLQLRFNDHSAFTGLVKDLDYLHQREIRTLMDQLERTKVEGKNAQHIVRRILSATPQRMHDYFLQWAQTKRSPSQLFGSALWSPTLVGGPATYSHEVFEADYIAKGVKLVEVSGGGNFTPLARRFGLPEGWQAIGIALGMMRFFTAHNMENRRH